MGADIHLYCEVKEKLSDDTEQWINCDHWKYNKWFVLDKEEQEFTCEHLYRDRNYNLFALLADVRNGGSIEPMEDPRGVPLDVSELTKKQIDRWNGDGHSHSYFTYNELVFHRNRIKNKKEKFSGWVPPEDAERFDRNEGFPDTWIESEDYAPKDWVYRRWECSYNVLYLDDLIDKIKVRMKEEFWINAESEYEMHGGKFRIVFFFDN